MKPIVTEGTNAFFGAEGFEKLPGQLYSETGINNEPIDCIQTVWDLTDEDVDAIIASHKIYVSVVGRNPQPICLDTVPFIE